ncbi:MAG: histone deacetylase family protein [Methanotrichaceae archaeon]|nr:histone deacetylase family protein [Methanotrichaceae archaeon]
MKIVYSRKYEARYPANPVENPGRVRLPAVELAKAGYEFVEPEPCSLEDISRVHGKEHIDRVRESGHFEVASLAAGGAIVAADLALQGEPAFALVRPPGHHAAANRAWGMCFFNNMAIAVKKIRPRAKKALIIDIDLHFGDGTVSIFRGDSDVKIVNPWSVDENFEYLNMDESRYLKQVEEAFLGFEYDIVGVSAGFDTYLEDWGGLLKREDYRKIGKAIREGAEKCGGRRFAVLEGGYHPDLKWCIKSFIEGFE